MVEYLIYFSIAAAIVYALWRIKYQTGVFTKVVDVIGDFSDEIL